MAFDVTEGTGLFELNLTSAKVHLLVLYAIAASCIARSSNPAADPSTKPHVVQILRFLREGGLATGNWLTSLTQLASWLPATCHSLTSKLPHSR